jgi:hypothetical protein
MAVDPTDFDHVLLTSHSPWNPSSGYSTSGVLETTDGGESWESRGWPNAWGTGHAINFLYSPELGIGNSDTWLVGTQEKGLLVTISGGVSWEGEWYGVYIAHGGSSVYYATDGWLYAGGYPDSQRTSDNGFTWEPVDLDGTPASDPTFCIFGDGTTLYTMSSVSDGPFYISPETDGVTWEEFPGGPVFNGGGLFEMVHDKINGILYASIGTQGIYALKL